MTAALAKAAAEIEARFDSSSDRNRQLRVAHLLFARARRRGLVTRFIRVDGFWPLMRWLSDYPAPRNFLSVDEALQWHRKALANQKLRRTMGHWSYRPEAIAIHRERIIVARYFARHGQAIWMREAA